MAGDPAVVDGDHAVPARMDRAAGDAGQVELAVVDGDLRLIDGGHRRANPHKIVGAKTLQVDLAVLYLIFALPVTRMALKDSASLPMYTPSVFFSGDRAALHQGGHAPLSATTLPSTITMASSNSPRDLIDSHQTVGFHVIGLRHGEDDVP